MEHSCHSTARKQRALWPHFFLRRTRVIEVALLLGIYGYHPFSQDGGIYLPTIMRCADTKLFTTDSIFVSGHSRFSLFGPLCESLIRLTHLRPEPAVFAIYLACCFAFVSGVQHLAKCLAPSSVDPDLAAIYASLFFGLPAAGTSLFVMDPYVTARSVTTPITLYALAAVLDRRYFLVSVLVVVCVLLHPLMGMCCGFTACVLAFRQERMSRVLVIFLLFSLGVAGVASRLQTDQAPAYFEALQSRTYLFLSGWTWYEVVGIVAPLGLLLVASRASVDIRTRHVCEACLITGAFSAVVFAAFVHTKQASLLVRLQPLRLFHTVYLLGLVLLAVWAVQRVRATPRWLRYAGLPALVACSLFLVNSKAYPEGWLMDINAPSYRKGSILEAFAWIQGNTPANATFSVDGDIWKSRDPEEDGFRAATGRSVLLDDKDEGLVTIFPDLAREWKRRESAQNGLADASDEQRRSRLSGFDVQYLLLPSTSKTKMSCPFRNASVFVCKL